MEKVAILIFYALYSVSCLGQHGCKYPKNLHVEFAVVEKTINLPKDAKFKVTFQNNGKRPLEIYDTLIDGELYGFDSNFLIELKIQESDTIWQTICCKYYGAIFPPEGSDFESKLQRASLNSKQRSTLSFDFFPNYVKYLKKGRYAAKIGLRKIPGSRKRDCGEYYFSEPIYFEVLNDLKQEGYR